MREPKFQQQAARVRSRRENLARKAAERDATDEAAVAADDEIHATDDESLDAELRQERAMAAANSVPARNQKAAEAQRRGRPTGKHPGRPSGKRRH
jgi:preprotein translocase subunit SecF